MQPTHAYESALRAEQVDQTRERILLAAGEELGEAGGEGFSVLGVARRARVAARTIYRYFPTREALLKAFGEWFNVEVGVERADDEDLVDLCERIFTTFARYEGVIRAVRWSKVVSDTDAPNRRRRIEALERRLATSFPGLKEAEVRRAAAAVHGIVSGATWVSLRDDHGFGPDEALEASRWALRVLARELRQRSDKARRRERVPAATDEETLP